MLWRWCGVANLGGADRADGDRPFSTRKQGQAGQRQDKGKVKGAGIRGGFQGVDRVLFRARIQGRDRVQGGDKVYSRARVQGKDRVQGSDEVYSSY